MGRFIFVQMTLKRFINFILINNSNIHPAEHVVDKTNFHKDGLCLNSEVIVQDITTGRKL